MGEIASQDTQKYIFIKKCAKFLYFSVQDPAWEAYSSHLGVRSAPAAKEKCPLQDKFWVRLYEISRMQISGLAAVCNVFTRPPRARRNGSFSPVINGRRGPAVESVRSVTDEIIDFARQNASWWRRRRFSQTLR